VSTAAVVTWQLEHRPHPEQGYRACLGLLALVACSSMARSMPSRRRPRSWSRVCSFNMGAVFLRGG
jgi:hypothetical protein